MNKEKLIEELKEFIASNSDESLKEESENWLTPFKKNDVLSGVMRLVNIYAVLKHKGCKDIPREIKNVYTYLIK